MNSNTYLKIFANCIIVKGANRSLILDGQRNSYLMIPDSMHDIIEHFQNKKSIHQVIDFYGEENKETVIEYIDFLIENEFGFLTNFKEFDLFVDMDKSFEIPSQISNCIIEISNNTILNIYKIIEGLESFNCKDIQIISYEILDEESLKKILTSTKNANFKSIELILKYSPSLFNFIPKIDFYNYRITKVVMHSCNGENKNIEKMSFEVEFLNYQLKDFRNCGIVDMKYFADINKYKVLESLNHNSCLNKKISIDKNGDIKNCPAMPESFGNIKDTSLEEALHKTNFKKYWNITKDQIEVCKDCEFRHICTDCRAYIENPEDQYSKPLKCGYNPYTTIWEEWSTNPLKQKAIEFYGMEELVKK